MQNKTMKNTAMENINTLIRIFNKNKRRHNKDENHHNKDNIMTEKEAMNNHHPIHVLKILNVLKHNPNINQRSLAKIINITPQAISDTLKKLENKGLITKTLGEENNESIINLTKIGFLLGDDYKIKLEEKSNEVFQNIDVFEIEIFNKTLIKILNNLEKEIIH